jgi:hypothetical protein
MIGMAKSQSRRNREKLAKLKGMDYITMNRGGQGIAISTATKSTKTLKEKQNQIKHKKRISEDFDSGNSAF